MARKRDSRMFHLVTRTWNPITGCLHNCKYCWARKLAEGRLRKTTRKYAEGFRPKFHPEELGRRFRPNELVFVSDMGDMWGRWVPDEWILRVLEVARRHPKTTFLFLTKNPLRYVEVLEGHGDVFSGNMIFGATIETLDDSLYSAYEVSRACPPSLRLQWLGIFAAKHEEATGRRPRTFVSVEPILMYWTATDVEVFAKILAESVRPEFVYVGYDNYNSRLPEPPLRRTLELVDRLRERGMTVYTKTMRRAWWEQWR